MKALILSVVLFSLSSIVSAQILTADVIVTNITCYGDNDGTISIANAIGGSGVYQYSINGGVSWDDDPDFYSLAAGVYSVRLRDKNNTNNSVILATVIITTPAQLEADVTFTNETILGANDCTITVINSTGGSGLYQYQLLSGTAVIRPWQVSNIFTGLAPGLYDVYIADAMVPFCYIHLTITVSNSVIDGIAIGIYRLYPVPVDENFTIELTGNNTAGALASVCSLQGKELLVANLTEVKTVLETTALQPGVYLLKVYMEGNCFMSKFVKL